MSTQINALRCAVFSITLAGLLAGCASATGNKRVAYLARDAQGRYEIQLTASYPTWNNGPPLLPWIPETYEEMYWIYTSAIEGEIPADQIVLTHARGKTESPWPQPALGGSLTVSSGHMHVALESPLYLKDGTIGGFAGHELNGDYILKRR